MRLSPETISQIPILYDKLKNKAAVARELNISTTSVNRYLTTTGNTDKAMTSETIEQVNKLYSECKNMSKVARELGISSATVKKYLSDENLKITKQQYDDRDALWYYIYRLFGHNTDEEPVSKWNITQMNKFKAQGMPYRGQLLTLKYFFEVKKNSIQRAKGSIGIIPRVWNESMQYYKNQKIKQEEVGQMIKKQLERDRKEIKYSPNHSLKKNRKKKIDLNTL